MNNTSKICTYGRFRQYYQTSQSFHWWQFVKQFLKHMMREKTILSKLLNFQKNNICAVGQRLHSPGNYYWLINKYKVCSDKIKTAYFGMLSSSLLDMAVRCGKPCSISIFSSVSSFTSPSSISCMLTMFVWNLLVISMSKKYQIEQAI